MKLLVLCFLVAFASSAEVVQKRSAYYSQIYSLPIPYISNEVGPYGYWLQYEPVPPLTAVADLKSYGEGAEISGRITFTQPPGGPVIYSGNVTGLSEGAHGFHIHDFGDLSNNCESLGVHFNPTYSHHGGPADPYRHMGDLGNIQAGSEGPAKIADSDHLISLNGPNSIIGRGLIITANKDDYGRGGDKESLRTGNSGEAVACGVIVWAQPPQFKPPQEAAKPDGTNSDAEVVEP